MNREEVEREIQNFLYYEEECNHDYYKKLFQVIYDLGHNDAKRLEYKPPKMEPLAEGENPDA